MNDYELMTILHPRLNADETAATVEAIQNRITGAGGTLLSTDVWGRRRLAYPINHVLEGTYVLFTLELEPSAARGIESWLTINEGVLRHLLIRGIIPYEGPDHRGSDRDYDRDRDDDRDSESEPEAAEPVAEDAPAAEAPAMDAPAPAVAAEPEAAPEPAVAAVAEEPPEAVAETLDASPADDADEPETARTATE